ncbi:alpha/beta hydrolase [Phycisphaera mikurensis]|uniref:Putative esterase n=1 Tax=Phycisphaera mikurensis (strain NBRC 102666 / KCTC 22515 / FYK2301M01) TaxID=1142394 RepID=I0IHD0_PHYMF|nr:alpha/beta hydrolase [Phycisphaera mikurensis]MBB6440917.1 acetyl esterase/lipase [Phycisphaera mikurensis]BAM04668.1 putative esterase [Phycisphaera mikurensis NBRC 102666]
MRRSRTATAAAALAAACLAGPGALAESRGGAGPRTGPAADGKALLDVQPAGEAPSFAPDIDPQMLAVLEEFQAFEPPKYPELTPFQVRMAVLPVNAVRSLAAKTGTPAAAPELDVRHEVLPVGPEEGLLARVYTPLDTGAGGPLPVIVYFHGGGWVIADLDAYAGGAEGLAAQAGAVVVSVAYRLAPEHTYPTAHEDAYAAFEHVAENAADFGGDPEKVVVAGESAGGNLAVSVALMAKERGGVMPKHIVSVYPVADGDVTSASYDAYAAAAPLNRPFMEWFFDHYTPAWKDSDASDLPYLFLKEQDLGGLPPTTILNAEIDPLATDGEELAAAMEQAGVRVMRKVYPGVTHEFFGMTPVLEQAAAAQKLAAEQIRATLERGDGRS